MREIGVLCGGNTHIYLYDWRRTNAAIRTPQEIEGAAMTESEKLNASSEPDIFPQSAAGPLVFISHDGRDAELAEAFSKLLKSVSAGMIKTFRSSDKKGTEGIDFGDEWYKRLMTKLQSTSDVVCLFYRPVAFPGRGFYSRRELQREGWPLPSLV